MHWTCPACGRKFGNPSQWHSCVRSTVNIVFNNKSVEMRELFDRLIDELEKLCEFRVEAAQNVLLFKSKSTFLAVKPTRKYLTLEFFLDRKDDIPPVDKILQTSTRRFAHRVRIDEDADLDGQLMSWISESYDLTS